METEKRKCNNCGEEWTDTGDEGCPFCGDENTYIIDGYWTEKAVEKRVRKPKSKPKPKPKHG